MNGLRRVVLIVALLNLSYFAVEFTVASRIASVSLFADSVDFLEDTSLNLLIALGLGWGAVNRARLGRMLALVLLVPGLATLVTAWHKVHLASPPAPVALGVASVGALVVNLSCAAMLARHRAAGGSLLRASYLSSRNDVIANLAILLTAGVTAWTRSGWADLVVGLGIAAMNADAAHEVWRAAGAEAVEPQ